MENYEKAIQEAMRLAATPQGQQLIRMLQKKGGANLQQTLSQASSGDLQQAKLVLSQLMEDPETRKLLEQLGR